MKNHLTKSIAAAALIAVLPAYAAQTNNGCQGNCPGGSGGPVTNTATGGSANANSTGIGVGIGLGGQGGMGGQGGQGGSASASGGMGGQGGIGVGGAGGNVTGSGNSANSNKNSNSAVQGQGQRQSSRNSNLNDNASTADAQAYGTATSVNHIQGDSVSYQAAKIPVATAYAPNIAPTALCMGSTSAGGQGMSFGFSVGTSWTDENCVLLEQVRTVAAVLGDRETAAEMLMGIPAYAEARARLSAKRQGSQAPVKVAEIPVGAGVANLARIEYTDPIIRARLGLPPLK